MFHPTFNFRYAPEGDYYDLVVDKKIQKLVASQVQGTYTFGHAPKAISIGNTLSSAMNCLIFSDKNNT